MLILPSSFSLLLSLQARSLLQYMLNPPWTEPVFSVVLDGHVLACR